MDLGSGAGMTRGGVHRRGIRFTLRVTSTPARHPGLDPGSIQFVLVVTALWIPARGLE